jgi:hypothetical protein
MGIVQWVAAVGHCMGTCSNKPRKFVIEFEIEFEIEFAIEFVIEFVIEYVIEFVIEFAIECVIEFAIEFVIELLGRSNSLKYAVTSCQQIHCRGQLNCDGTRAETRFRLSAKRTSPFISAEASVQSTADTRVVRVNGSNARYTMFRGSVMSTSYPLHLPVSSSLPLPCVTVCHHISIGLYKASVPERSVAWALKHTNLIYKDFDISYSKCRKELRVHFFLSVVISVSCMFSEIIKPKYINL